MNLQKFDHTNIKSIRAGESTISFSRKAACTISQHAVLAIGLQPDDTITVLQDQDNPEDWYLAVNLPEGFPLRSTGKESKALAFNNAALANMILDWAGHDGDRITFKLVTDGQGFEDMEGVQLYPIITASAK